MTVPPVEIPLGELADDVLQASLDNADTELTSARGVVATANDACLNAFEKWKALNEEYARRKLEGDVDIAFVLQALPETKVTYDYFTSLIREYELYSGGYWPTTNQRCIGVKFNKQDCDHNLKQIDGLKMFIPHVLPIKNGKHDKIIEGCKPFSILEHTLSERGVYNFYLCPNNTVMLAKTSWGSTTYTKIGDFDTAMKYIQHHYWYTSNDDNNSDD